MQIEAVQAGAARAVGGMLVGDEGPADDPDFLSRPTVRQMYLCAGEIGVSRARLGAEVRLLLDGTPIGEPLIVSEPGLVVFDLATLEGVEEFEVGQLWTAQQRFDGSPWSQESDAVSPIDHTEVYPDGLPAPVVSPTPVYDCSQSIAVGHVEGATLHIERSIGADFDARGTPLAWSVVSASTVFETTEELAVAQSLCGDMSLWSAEVGDPVVVLAEPYPIDPPAVPDIYDEQQLILVSRLTHGTTQEVGTDVGGGLGMLASWPTSIRGVDMATLLARPLMEGESVTIEQQLCDASSMATSAPALSCDLLPPVEIQTPADGDREVRLEGAHVPGGTVRVWSGMEEIGDSSGRIINLSRPLVSGETLRVVHELSDSCRAGSSFSIGVP